MCQLCAFRHFLGFFHKFCFNVQTCHHIGGGGGGMCIFLCMFVCSCLCMCIYTCEVCVKRSFSEMYGFGGGGVGGHIFQYRAALDAAHKHCTAPLNHVDSEPSSSSALPFSGRAGTPWGVHPQLRKRPCGPWGRGGRHASRRAGEQMGGGGTLDKQNGPPLWRVGCGTGGSGLYKWGTKSEGPTLAAVGRAGGGEMQAAPLHCASEAALCCEATADGASGTRRKALIIPAQQKHGSRCSHVVCTGR